MQKKKIYIEKNIIFRYHPKRKLNTVYCVKSSKNCIFEHMGIILIMEQLKHQIYNIIKTDKKNEFQTKSTRNFGPFNLVKNKV